MSDLATSGAVRPGYRLAGGALWLAVTWALTVLLLASLAVWLQWRYDPPSAAAPAPLPETVQPVAELPELPAETAVEPDAEPQEVPPAPRSPVAAPQTPGMIAGALAPAPDPDLVESGPHGLLPVIAADGRRPLDVYARPFDGAPGDRPIAIVIQEIGLSRATTEAVLASLPAAVTLALSPYGTAPQETAREVRGAGHEVLLMVPMEPVNWPANDPGPHSLLVDRPAEETLDRLHFVMSRFQGYVGIVNHMGSRFSAVPEALAPVMRDLAGRGLMVLDARASARSAIPQSAAAAGVPVAVNSRYIDNIAAPEDIDRMLAELVAVAQSRGSAIGIGRPYPVTLARLARWAGTLDARGVVLAPVSALVGTEP